MSKVNLREASLENEERKADKCATCSGPADEAYEPYCMSCASYWEDVKNGLFDDLDDMADRDFEAWFSDR